MNGFINVIKPEGMSSAAVVGKIKKKLNAPCGHMGTLDPLASGVLPIGVGKATRLFNFLLDKDKVYEAEFTFGYETDTLDRAGEIVNRCDSIPTLDMLENIRTNFIGEIEQMPPKYSAKNVNGKRGYELAREGVEFTLQPKKVVINDIAFKNYDKGVLTLTVDCKGGTYIRSLARDFGEGSNSLATMTKLKRTKSGVFTIENGVLLDEFLESVEPLKYMLGAHIAVSYPEIMLDEKTAKKLMNGQRVDMTLPNGYYKVFFDKAFWGVGEIIDKNLKLKANVKE